MKRIKSFITSRLGFAVISNVVTFMVSLLLYRPFWEENDDVAMAILAEGVYGENDPHLIYSNIIYGKILTVLGSLIRTVRWHSVLMLLFSFVVSTAFVYVLLKYRSGKILSLIFLAACFYEVYVALQFSKISAFIAIMAYMILFDSLIDEIEVKKRRILLTIGFCGAFYAQLLRLESFLLATMIAGIFGICLVIRQGLCGELRSRITGYIKVFLPLFASVAISIVIDHAAYASGGWKDYMDYFYAVSEMTDYHFDALSYEKHSEELKELGISENDALMFITYEGSDTNFLTLDLMNRISQLDKKGAGYIDADFMKAWVANIYDETSSLNGVTAALVMMLGLLIAGIVSGQKKGIYIAYIAAQSVITLVVLFYYQYSSRWCHRIVYALFLCQLVALVYVLDRMKELNIGMAAAVCMVSVMVMSLAEQRLGNEFEYQRYKREAPDYEEAISFMESNKDKLFVGDVFTMLDYGKYDIFRAAGKGQFDNYIYTDSVFLTNSPVYKEIAGKFGYSDPFEAMKARDERVILADNMSPDVELIYCNEHGDGGKYELEELEGAGNMRMYSIR